TASGACSGISRSNGALSITIEVSTAIRRRSTLRVRTRCAWLASRSVLVAALALAAAATPRATPPTPAHRDITYILPLFPVVPTPQVMNDFKTSIGEGPYVKTGFSSYVVIDMINWTVDIHDHAAVRAALASTFADIDANIAHAVALGVPW